MSKLIGVEHKKGEVMEKFKGTGVFYDYYLLHVITSGALNEVNKKGVFSSIIKIKQSEIPEKNPLNWIGKEIDINYNDKNIIKSIYLDDTLHFKNEGV